MVLRHWWHQVTNPQTLGLPQLPPKPVGGAFLAVATFPLFKRDALHLWIWNTGQGRQLRRIGLENGFVPVVF